MPAPFKLYKLTDAQVRADGLATGRNWSAPWTPGGPWVPRKERPGSDPEWDAYCALRAHHNRLWRDAWREGTGRA